MAKALKSEVNNASFHETLGQCEKDSVAVCECTGTFKNHIDLGKERKIRHAILSKRPPVLTLYQKVDNKIFICKFSKKY